MSHCTETQGSTALKGFVLQIDFHETGAVCVSAGQQAAGAGCQRVCSYFLQSKFRQWPISM